MTGYPSSAPRARRLAFRGLLAGMVTALALVSAPGTASAATGTITPTVKCYQPNSDGSVSVLLGYTNTTGRQQTIARGVNNKISPSKYDGTQPTTFKTGTNPAVFSVKIASSDLWSTNWTLNGASLSSASSVSQCPPDTVLPAAGNGTGIAIALLAAGAVGAVALRRVRRSTALPTAGPAEAVR